VASDRLRVWVFFDDTFNVA